jgi:hypothetical protein
VPRAAIVASIAFGALFLLMILAPGAVADRVAVIGEQVEVGLGLDILPGEQKDTKPQREDGE